MLLKTYRRNCFVKDVWQYWVSTSHRLDTQRCITPPVRLVAVHYCNSCPCVVSRHSYCLIMHHNRGYSFDDLTAILLVCGKAKPKFSSCTSFAEMYPQQGLPNPRTLIYLDSLLRETVCLWPSTADAGRQRSHRSASVQEDTLHAVQWLPHDSSRRLASFLCLHRESAERAVVSVPHRVCSGSATTGSSASKNVLIMAGATGCGWSKHSWTSPGQSEWYF